MMSSAVQPDLTSMIYVRRFTWIESLVLVLHGLTCQSSSERKPIFSDFALFCE